MKLIDRKEYLNKIINIIGAPDIKVITSAAKLNLIICKGEWT